MRPLDGLAAAALLAAALSAGGAPEALLRARPTHPDTLATLQGRVFPNRIPASDRVTLSLFSSLFRDPKDPPDVFWSCPDRGPNDERMVDGETRRVFLTPGFDPVILRVRVDRRTREISVEQALFLRTTAGGAVTGLPNRPGVDEAGYDASGRASVGYNPDGLDPEALVRAADGSFWLAEEYGPSLVHVAADGRVLARHVPVGAAIASPGYPVLETLPPILGRRKQNRGFESLAISRDGRRLFAVLEGPLANPDAATAATSRQVRLLVADPASGRALAEHVLVMAPAGDFGAERQADVKFADAAWVNERELLLVHRTDRAAKLFLADLGPATNLLGTAWDDPATQPSLEQLAAHALEGHGVVPAALTLVADLSAAIPDLPQKVEGLAVLDATTVAIGNDNEFAARVGRAPNEIVYVRLPQPLPLE